MDVATATLGVVNMHVGGAKVIAMVAHKYTPLQNILVLAPNTAGLPT